MEKDIYMAIIAGLMCLAAIYPVLIEFCGDLKDVMLNYTQLSSIEHLIEKFPVILTVAVLISLFFIVIKHVNLRRKS